MPGKTSAKKPAKKRAKTGGVDGYLASLPAEVRGTLGRVRRAIRRGMPRAVERMSYGMPAYSVDGRVVLYFGAWKKHFAIYPASRGVVGVLEAAGVLFESSKGTVKFAYDDPPAAAVIAAVARARCEELGGAGDSAAAGDRGARARTRRRGARTRGSGR